MSGVEKPEVIMASMLTAYLAGIGTVIAAITVGFSGGVWLADAPATKEPSAAYTGRFNRPHVELSTQAQAPAPASTTAADANPPVSGPTAAEDLSQRLHQPALAEAKSEPRQDLREQADKDSAVTSEEAVRRRTENARKEQLRIKTERRKKLAELKKRRALARAKIVQRDRDDVVGYYVDYYGPRHYEVESQRIRLFRSQPGSGFLGD